MTRSLLVPLTGVVVTLAVLLQNVWLYAAGGVALFLLLVLLIGYLWRWFSGDRAQFPSSYEEVPSQPSLEDLGITEIRPKNQNVPAPTERTARAADAEESEDLEYTDEDNRAAEEKDSRPPPERSGESSTLEAGGGLESVGDAPEAASGAAETSVSTAPRQARSTESNGSTASEPDERTEEAGARDGDLADGERAGDGFVHTHTEPRPLGLDAAEIVRPHLEALRAGIHAQTVCLIGLRGETEGYRIEASVSRSPRAAEGGVIAAEEHFLQSVAPEEPVTILVAEGEGPSFEDLGYYSDEVAVGLVAISPVHTEQGVVAYLLADRPKDAPAVPASHYRLLARSAELLGHMIDVRVEERPRREIIAEEMERARGEDRPLALALVHPIDAEEISAQGPRAVQEGEGRLEQLLAESTGHGRIERFGELIYGVFYYDSEDTVEDWAQEVQEAFADAGWGANMGVAIFSERHEGPEDLRGDATEALRVAYEAGENECIIFE